MNFRRKEECLEHIARFHKKFPSQNRALEEFDQELEQRDCNFQQNINVLEEEDEPETIIGI